jgi:hypothetical protein
MILENIKVQLPKWYCRKNKKKMWVRIALLYSMIIHQKNISTKQIDTPSEKKTKTNRKPHGLLSAGPATF